MAAREPAHRLPVGHVSEPAIARIGTTQAPRGARHVGRKRLPELHDLQAGQVAQMGEGERGAKGIFLFPQMPDHRDAKMARRRLTRGVDLG